MAIIRHHLHFYFPLTFCIDGKCRLTYKCQRAPPKPKENVQSSKQFIIPLFTAAPAQSTTGNNSISHLALGNERCGASQWQAPSGFRNYSPKRSAGINPQLNGLLHVPLFVRRQRKCLVVSSNNQRSLKVTC